MIFIHYKPPFLMSLLIDITCIIYLFFLFVCPATTNFASNKKNKQENNEHNKLDWIGTKFSSCIYLVCTINSTEPNCNLYHYTLIQMFGMQIKILKWFMINES